MSRKLLLVIAIFVSFTFMYPEKYTYSEIIEQDNITIIKYIIKDIDASEIAKLMKNRIYDSIYFNKEKTIITDVIKNSKILNNNENKLLLFCNNLDKDKKETTKTIDDMILTYNNKTSIKDNITKIMLNVSLLVYGGILIIHPNSTFIYFLPYKYHIITYIVFEILLIMASLI